jgi:hypothetical protein
MKRQQGQSMTEFAVGAAVLSLLLLGTLALAGYQEVDRRLVIAARKSAWEQSWAAVTDPVGASPSSLHREFFDDSGVLEPTGRQLLVEEDDLNLQHGRREPTGIAGTTADVMLAPLRVASGFLGAGFDLSGRGLHEGSVRATVGPLARMPAPFDELELQLRAPYGLLGDAWHAAGLQHVMRRAGGLVPTGPLAALNAIWQPLSVPLGVLEPSLGQLCFGLIEPDRVPEDRLGPGRTPLPRGCP